MHENPAALSDALLQAAHAAGADAADALVHSGTALYITVREGALEQAQRAESLDVGLRVLVGQRQACVSVSETSPAVLADLAERAVAMAREAPEDPTVGLAAPEDLARDWDIAALDLVDPTPELPASVYQQDALDAEAAAKDFAGISKVESASAGYTHVHTHIAATNGFSGGYERSNHGISCVAITGSGTEMERDYYSDSRAYKSDMMAPADVGRIAAERTLARAGARQPKTGTFSVLFDERIAGSLIGHLLSAVNGTAVARGASYLRDALETPVLPAGIDLVEDPLRPRALGSRPFDAEGLPTRRREIVKDGVLQGWTLDLASARKLGLSSTGNARRGVTSPPSPGVGNVALTPGSHSLEQLMSDMGTGLWVTSMIGSTINATTGDYSRGASGIWVENGEPAYAVNECTIAGNLKDMLPRIQPANDARQHLSRVVPSLLVEGLTIAGA